tara:strand:+ start:514 stop:900 length:387 start_codon:yes stop_codon:yes gene_type:complete
MNIQQQEEFDHQMNAEADYWSEIADEMDLWRMGAIGLPASYIAYKKKKAEEDLPGFAAKNGFKIWGTEMVYDGWMDGMKFLAAVVEGKHPTTGEKGLFKIKFADNERWYHDYPGHGGWGLIFEKKEDA